MKKFITLFLITILLNMQNLVFALQEVDSSKYIFDSSKSSSISPQVIPDEDVLKGYVAQVQAGTTFDVYLKNSINTATASKGDIITAVLTKDFVFENRVIAPQGSIVQGTLSKARNATYAYQNGYIQINFNKIITDDKEFKITAEKIDFKVDSTGKLSSVAGKVVAGAAIGLLGGLLAMAFSSSDSKAKSVAIGTAIGAGSGAIASIAEKGVDAEIPAFTQLNLVLEKPLNVSFTY